MADFNKFWPILEKQEGLYANAKNDSGGETWKGISRNNYPSWAGWKIVDAKRPKTGFINESQANAFLKGDATLDKLTVEFYKNSQWDPIKMDQIANQSIANFICDWGVNAGLSVPIKKAQKILSLVEDGVVGPKTLAAINGASGQDFFNKMQEARESFYRSIVAAKPSQQVFLKTWLTRNKSFAYSA